MTTAPASHQNCSPVLSRMIEAALAAGQGLREDFLQIASLEIERKIGPDPVSAADLRAEATLRTALASSYPDYGFLGEEGGLVAAREEIELGDVDRRLLGRATRAVAGRAPEPPGALDARRARREPALARNGSGGVARGR